MNNHGITWIISIGKISKKNLLIYMIFFTLFMQIQKIHENYMNFFLLIFTNSY